MIVLVDQSDYAENRLWTQTQWFHMLYKYCKSSTYFFSPTSRQIAKFLKIFEIVYMSAWISQVSRHQKRNLQCYIPLDSTSIIFSFDDAMLSWFAKLASGFIAFSKTCIRTNTSTLSRNNTDWESSLEKWNNLLFSKKRRLPPTDEVASRSNSSGLKHAYSNCHIAVLL